MTIERPGVLAARAGPLILATACRVRPLVMPTRDPRPAILTIDPDALTRDNVRTWLVDAGWSVLAASTPAEALRMLERRSPTVVVCDVACAEPQDDTWLVRDLLLRVPSARIIVTGPGGRLPGGAWVRPGVAGCLLTPYERSDLLDLVAFAAMQAGRATRVAEGLDALLIDTVERRHALHLRLDAWLDRANGTRSPRRWVRVRPWRSVDAGTPADGQPLDARVLSLAPNYDATRMAWLGDAAVTCGRRLCLPPETIADLETAAVASRLGLAVIPPPLLSAPRALTPAERHLVQRYPGEGRDALARLGRPRAGVLVGLMRERWDGGGYPWGVAGADLPIAVRLLSVLDALSAMTLPRGDRPSLTWDRARAEVAAGAGTHFDATVLDIVLSTLTSPPPVPDEPMADRRPDPHASR